MANETTVTPAVEAAPTPPPIDINMVREAQKRGLLDKLSPAERAQILTRIESQFEAERQEALKPQAELLDKPPEQRKGIIDELLTPVRAAIENPAAATVSLARGVARSYNPGALVGADLENVLAAVDFPIVRGAELAARLFVPEDQRPSLTTYKQLVDNQRGVDKTLRQLSPGIQEGAEAGTALFGAYELARLAAPAVGKKIAEFRAGRAVKKTERLAARLARTGEGPLLDAYVKRPENVKAVLDGSKDATVSDLADELTEELDTIGQKLGKKVGEFRDRAIMDTKTRIAIPDEVKEMIENVRLRTTLDGESQLPAAIQAKINRVSKMAELGVTTPNQALVMTDTMQDVINYGAARGSDGAAHVQSANHALKGIRRVLKDSLRGESAEWAKADELYSGYQDVATVVKSKLAGYKGESLVDNLFGRNKTGLRMDIEAALNYMEAIDPTARGHGAAFFDRLADVKAAARIKGGQTAVGAIKTGGASNVRLAGENVDRVAQEAVHEIVRRYERSFGTIGATAGGGAGVGLGIPFGGGVGVGGAAGWAIGSQAGRAVGVRMADPTRILTSALKAKNLSSRARQLATDMLYITKTFGPEGNIALLDVIGRYKGLVPVFNELQKAVNTVGKGEENANSQARK